MVPLIMAFQPHTPVMVSPMTALPALLGIAALICMRAIGLRKKLPNLIVAAEALLQMTLFTLGGILLSYAIAARGGVLWDDHLAAADRMLGLQWGMLRDALDQSVVAVWLLTIAYHSLIAQMVVAILLLAGSGRHAELRRLILAALIAGLVTILVSGLVPAMGNLFDAAQYRHLPTSVASMHADIMTGLRDGSFRTVDLRQMMGIVTFPSYHAALALLFIWAFYQKPRARLAGGSWATLTILATPISGGHYGVDVITGLWLGALALATVTGLARYANARTSSALHIRERPEMPRFFASS